MKVFVISLPGATIRRSNSASQLREANIEFDFFDAHTGEQALANGYAGRIDESRWLLNTGRGTTAAEIGCYSSHRALWSRCVEMDEPLMIMEDDFDLSDRFAEAVREAELAIDNFGFIRLQTERRACKRMVQPCGDMTLVRYTKAPHSLMCYALAPRLARTLVARTATMKAPVDVVIKKYWEFDHALYGLMPYTVDESHLSPDSCIPNRNKTEKDMVTRLRRVTTKTSWHLRRAWFNFSLGLRTTES